MDQDIKDLVKRLGEALNESMQDSEKIQRLLREMEEKGFAISLSLAVILGVDQQQRARRKQRREPAAGREPASFTSAFDRKFLKALRIKQSEEPKV